MTSFKEKLASGTPVSGPIVGDIRTVGAIKALANAGHDFVWLDMEHAMIGWETLVPLVQFARLSGITPLVRATDLSYPLVARALDAGAIGIIVPLTAARCRRGSVGLLWSGQRPLHNSRKLI